MERESLKKILLTIFPRKMGESLIIHLGRWLWYVKDLIDKPRNTSRQREFLRSFYNTTNPVAHNKEKIVIFMCDEKVMHGGLSDRLQGLVSTYKICKEANIQFCAYFVSPFPLENYLQPNHYNWTIKTDDISYNSNDSIAECLYRNDKYKWLKNLLLTSSYKQIHLYTNAVYTTKETFSHYFNELFKLTPVLQQQINEHYKEIGRKYVALTFRFQNLMGDFKDGDCRPLSREEQVYLLKKCVEEILKIKKLYPDFPKFLITSDSVTLLEKIKNMPFVYIIPGSVTHTDNISDYNDNAHFKTFVDFFMLSKAQKVICMRTGPMFKAGFPRTAASVNNVPFEYHQF